MRTKLGLIRRIVYSRLGFTSFRIRAAIASLQLTLPLALIQGLPPLDPIFIEWPHIIEININHLINFSFGSSYQNVSIFGPKVQFSFQSNCPLVHKNTNIQQVQKNWNHNKPFILFSHGKQKIEINNLVSRSWVQKNWNQHLEYNCSIEIREINLLCFT